MANVNDLETIKKETEPSYDPNSTETIENMTERAAPDALKTGDFVSWNSSGGTARGRHLALPWTSFVFEIRHPSSFCPSLFVSCDF